MKEYTDFFAPFFNIDVATKPHGDVKRFDWNKAKDIVDEAVAKNPNCRIYVGLAEDWNNTAGLLYGDGAWNDPFLFYGASTWATPIVDINGVEIECWTYDKVSWETRDCEWLMERC